VTAYPCPVCGFPNLPDPPVDMSYEICPSCGTEFGYTDFRRSHDELMSAWLRTGPRWFATWVAAPAEWNGRRQLIEHKVPKASMNASAEPIGQPTADIRPVPEQRMLRLVVADTSNRAVA
jgi:hypothetical protein